MTNPSKRKGTAFESELLGYLQARGMRDLRGPDPAQLHRRVLTGNLDRGDIGGWTGWTMEAKNTNSANWAIWSDEAEKERKNDGADYGLLIVRRRMKVIEKAYAVLPLEQMVTLMQQDYDSRG